jgi:hypothetical protein
MIATCFVVVKLATGLVVYTRTWDAGPIQRAACESVAANVNQAAADRRRGYRIICEKACPPLGGAP